MTRRDPIPPQRSPMRQSPRTHASKKLSLAAIAVVCACSHLRADYKTAVSLFKKQQYQEALRELQPDVSRNPNWEFGHRLAGLCYFYLRDYPKATQALEHAVALKSTEASVYLGLAESQFQLDRPERALDALDGGKAYVKRRLDLYNYHRLRGYVLQRLSRFPEAVDEMLQAFQQQAGSAQDYLALGLSYMGSGDDKNARQSLATAVGIDPGLKPAQSALDSLTSRETVREAENALRREDYARARALFKEASEKDPRNKALAFNLALAEVGLKNWGGALEVLLQLDAQYRDSYRFQYLTGRVLEELGKKAEAEGAYLRAAALRDTGEVKEALKRVGRKRGGR